MKYKRKKKLVEPRLQLKFTLIFFTTTSIAILVQALLFAYMFNRVAKSLPNDGSLLLSQFPSILSECLVLTSVLLLPLTLVVGIRSTFRIVGPMYRFRVFLNELIAGKQTEPCRIRANDELHDFCDLLNRATESLRAEAETSAEVTEHPEPDGAVPSEAEETAATG